MGRYKLIVFVLLITASAALLTYFFLSKNKEINNNLKDGISEITKEVTKNTMNIKSDAFENNTFIPEKYTCDGENINPELIIENVPENAVSMALIMDDPDAPSGDFVHWLVWNMSPKLQKIDEGSVPDGVIQGLTSANNNKYNGPCPPSGTHRYQFKIYALDTKLELQQTANKKGLLDAMNGHIIEENLLTGLYKR